MPITSDDIIATFGRLLVYGTPVTAAVVFLGKRTAEKWIDARFAQRQKVFEHEQAKELQRLKVKIDTVVQGALKLQEREFKIIPEAWEKISNAFAHAAWLTSPLQSYAELRTMTSEELEEFLSKTELTDTQKQTLRAARPNEIDKLWQKMSDWLRRNAAMKALGEADTFVKINGVFIPVDLHEQFLALAKIVHSALVAWSIGRQHDNYDLITKGGDQLSGEGAELHKSIEAAIRKRLIEQTVIAEQPIA